MSKVKAIARILSKTDAFDGQVRIQWYAPYADESGERIPENAEWAKYTPALGIDMTVLDEVAEKLEQGKDYILTFEERQ